MKIIELKLKEQETGEGITAISLVKNPAIEQNWIAFNTQGGKLKPDKKFAFKTIDEEQRIIAGPAMIPDKLIYRIDPDGEESFVFFTSDTIRQLSERFLLQGKQGSITLDHEATLNDLSVVESWIVEDSEKDKSAMYGFDLPIGSWFVKVKVLNNDIWSLVKNQAVSGFSVEGVFTKEEVTNKIEKMKATKLDEYLNKIKGLFSEVPAEPVEPVKPEIFGSVDATTTDGTVITIAFPGDVLEAGAVITHSVDGADAPVPTGEYLLSDGAVLVVTEEGVVGELRVSEEAPPEEEMENDGLKAEQIDALIDGIAQIIANFQVEVKGQITQAVTDSATSLREEFNKPAVKVIPPNPEDKTKDQIVKGLNRFVEEAKDKK